MADCDMMLAVKREGGGDIIRGVGGEKKRRWRYNLR
jgi:hypothetical protein